MPKMIGKNLHMCFTKITCPPSPQSSPLNNPDHDDQNHSRPSLFIKNFNSLYNDYDSNSNSKPLSLIRTHSFSTLSSDCDSDSEPDFATVVASQRFFFTSPGRSNSIVESTPSVSTPASYDHTSESSDQSNNRFSCAKDSVAVPTDSPDPYVDFRRSMQEMVEARDSVNVKADWDYLHELLLCYLSLNPKTAHKFIMSAFADLLVSLMSPPETDSKRRREK